MDAKMTFDQLLATAGNGDLEKLRAKKTALESEKARLQEKLTKVNRDLWEICSIHHRGCDCCVGMAELADAYV